MLFRKRKSNNHNLDLEEVLLDHYTTSIQENAEIKPRKLEIPINKTIFGIFFASMFLAIASLAVIAFWGQIAQGEEYAEMAKQNKFLMANLKSERGIIYDRNMSQLVWNEAGFDLMADREILQDIPEEGQTKAIQTIADITSESIENIKAALANEATQETKVAIVKNLDHKSLVLLETKREELDGFYINKIILRHYEKLSSLSHILGYLGRISLEDFQAASNEYEIGDYVGKEGIERRYEDVLKEQKGKIQIERNAKGEEISQQVIQEPESGESLVLNIDLNLQKKCQEVLQQVIDEIGTDRGVVIALAPSTGAVLAEVSLPSFDNNLFSGGISQTEFAKLNSDPLNPQLNRAISGLYPTGSTIKPFMGAAALEEGVITETTTLYCPQELCLVNQYTGEGECSPDWTFHGYSDIKRAIAESVNPFFYMIGGGYKAPSKTSPYYDERLPKNLTGLGVYKIAEYLEKFGFGTSTDIDLPGEALGRVPTPEWKEGYFSSPVNQKWYQGDTYNLSIGQGYLLSTPMQLATAYTAIANNGPLMAPKIAKEILGLNKENNQVIAPQVLNDNFISPNTLRIIREGMRQTVTSGSGSAASLQRLPVTSAAKTGTAQIYPNKEIYLNWVAVFAPYDNPEILIIVLVEDVPGITASAQRVAREVLDWYFYGQYQED